ncbi:Valyl-tRNA synthetase [Caenispirillum salinarum AK4]|uniref:Valine--tRNA ligase n=1 Tax=Caenispirillum salinarum AK4 TaxID=1238182 RepID=K9HMI5_9PROT|nr:valine--tRNA ligase [Caenispirillum salinarum]EKV31533.1 Valyl-tRNA synthetase [Caenispirillum salinarum AK4]
MLDKTYNAAEVEQKLYARWEESGVFACNPKADGKTPYTIMMPPPNVTGTLHMGHALTFTLQDALIRFHRMQGRDVLWQPGTDHAGIATQMVVERNLEKEGKTRHDLGREKFIEKVWEWKAQSGGAIINQLRRLGASADWPRERFTMDDGLSAAVRKIFVDLHRKGLIYRDKRLVNWDPKLHTAISDLEVDQRETVGKMWYFRYPVEGQEGVTVTVGTTRPETMLGDTGVAVHPDDERYADLIGKHVVLPIVGRRIPIVADEYADPEKGSGAVKITPAHDFNDFEVGRRNGLEMINVLDRDARINENAPEGYIGLDRFEAREKIVAEFEAQGLLEKVEENPMTVPYGDRSGVVIEPWLTDQWFVDAKTLAQEPIKAVEEGRTRFVPKQWEKTFFEWMRNIQPWCVSRQIWWGHQVPAWFGPDGEIFVEETEAEAQGAADKHYGKTVELTRDTDVLDTWFSSALWPFSTLGWPEETEELKRYYPTDVLVTGFDIIFFWVARMMMFGHYGMDEVPFKDVYIHALVRDEHGQKMSKSKGNVIDPLTLIDEYGADALRFTLVAMAAQGRDIKMSEQRVAGYRNFCTKIWNAARFCEMNECRPDPAFQPAGVTSTLNRWIVGKAAETAATVAKAVEEYKFNEAAQAAYGFTWNTFCDWFLEFAKPVFHGEDEAAKAETRATAAWVLDQILVMLHPFMPYLTEELWGQIGGTARESMLAQHHWTDAGDVADAAAAEEMDWVVELISSVRSVRSEMNVPPGARLGLQLKDASPETVARMERHAALIKTLARLDSLEAVFEAPAKGAAQTVVGEATVILPLAGVIDVDQEKARLEKELKKVEGEISKLSGKLGNEKFLAKAPADVVAEQRERLADAEGTRDKLRDAYDRLAAL